MIPFDNAQVLAIARQLRDGKSSLRVIAFVLGASWSTVQACVDEHPTIFIPTGAGDGPGAEYDLTDAARAHVVALSPAPRASVTPAKAETKAAPVPRKPSASKARVSVANVAKGAGTVYRQRIAAEPGYTMDQSGRPELFEVSLVKGQGPGIEPVITVPKEVRELRTDLLLICQGLTIAIAMRSPLLCEIWSDIAEAALAPLEGGDDAG